MKHRHKAIWFAAIVWVALLLLAWGSPAWGSEGGTLPPAICDTISQIPRAECEALRDFYRSMNGPEEEVWRQCSGAYALCPQPQWYMWFHSDQPCDWASIGCSPGSPEHVIALDMVTGGSATGTLPATLADLTELRSLTYIQQPEGPLPDVLLELPDLEHLWVYGACVPQTLPFLALRARAAAAVPVDVLPFCPGHVYIPLLR